MHLVSSPVALGGPLEFVTVGDPGNTADTTGYGSVNYVYRIGKFEVTIGQYADFLNAVASNDPYELYDTRMAPGTTVFNPGPAALTGDSTSGITRNGGPGNYTYTVAGPAGSTPTGADSPGNRPIAWVTWWDAARFVNWIENGQGAGDTETGAYTLSGSTSGPIPAKNLGANYWLPTENEWYKAAFFSPDKGGSGSPGYYLFATQSDTTPGNAIGAQPNQVNYRVGGVNSVTQSSAAEVSQNYLTNVGAFSASPSAYGTFDQSGGLWEWNDLDGAGGTTTAGQRSGSFFNDSTQSPSRISSAVRNQNAADSTFGFNGFRVAAVPEPSACVTLLAGLACGGFWLRRRQNAAKRTARLMVLPQA
jgi:sulfatase modifying factor 1